ncbi:hypothetical protein A3Q56_06217 [Intoshia linei]|uniref:long-chain-fatty-acid--CoA ligase n=1 Tax=Intoshia linei TaxID=1819745 RepID=A0A177AW49_9BILA|nr:hypothetical protein A3Q56_06217 [Intoshia linei]
MVVEVLKVEELSKDGTVSLSSKNTSSNKTSVSTSKKETKNVTKSLSVRKIFCKAKKEVIPVNNGVLQSSSHFTFTEYDNEYLFSDTLPYIVTDVHSEVRLRKDNTNLSAMTVCDLLQQTIRADDVSSVALAHQTNIGEKWNCISYPEYYSKIKLVSKSLLALGVQEGEGVAIIGFNHYKWHLTFMGAIHIGAIGVGIYTTNTAETNLANFRLAKCTVIVVDNQKQIEKLDTIRDQIPNLRGVIVYNDDTTNCSYGEYHWDDFLDLSSKNETLDDEFECKVKSLKPNKCCSIVFTSGTTGNPKAAMLSHDNLVWTARRFCKAYGPIFGNERLLSYLPLSHVAAQMLDIIGPIVVRSPVFFAQPSALKGTLKFSLNEVHPTVFLGVPRVFEKIHERIVETALSNGYIKRKIGHWAKNVGYKYSQKKAKNEITKDPWSFKLANAMVYKKIKKVLGLDQCRFLFYGAAPMHDSTMDFFVSLGLYIHSAYGLSETAGAQSVMFPGMFHTRTVGKPYDGTHVRINEDDLEIQAYGRNIFMGYKENEAKTDAAFTKDFYLRTGDQGKWEGDQLQIVGRIKELIITAGGENISTGNIENAVRKNLPCLSNIVIVGDQRKYLVALLTLKLICDETGVSTDELALESKVFCENHGSDTTTIGPIAKKDDKAMVAAIQDSIDRANKLAANNPHKIQKWVVLKNDFSVPTGELGPTLKTKKHVVYSKYSDIIDEMYK